MLKNRKQKHHLGVSSSLRAQILVPQQGNQGILKTKQKIGQTNLVLVQVRACVSRAKVQTHSYRSLNLPNLKHLSVLSVIKRQDSQSSEVLLVENIAFMSGVRQMTPFG